MHTLENPRFPLAACLIGLAPLLLACPSDDSPAADAGSSSSSASGSDATSAGATTETVGSGGMTAATDMPTSPTTTADTGSSGSDGTGQPSGGIETCEDMAEVFVNAPASTETTDCALADGTSATCCRFTFSSGVAEDGPYCPPSRTSAPPYGLSVYDGATNPGLRAFNGAYLDDIEADGYEPMVDENGDTNIVTGLGPGGGAADGSNCLAIDQDADLTVEVSVPLAPTMGTGPTELREVENLGVSLAGVPGTGHPPSATLGPMMGGPPGGATGAINVPSIGSCGAHPDPAGYLHDHFVPQVMNAVLEANGIAAAEVECTRYEQDNTALYGFAKDGFPIYASRDEGGVLPETLDVCNGHEHATPEFPGGIYHYHGSETAAPNFMTCLSGVAVEQSFRYY